MESNWGPPIFTHNSALDPDGYNRHNVRAFCRQYGLLTKQIYYVPSKKHYCKESRATYSSFLIDTKPWSGHRILSDAARFFHWEGKDFFEELGFEAHRSFIPSAHGQLSIIDGFINPWAKAGWRSSRNAFASQWETTLLLAHEILHISRQEAAKAWERHLLVGSTPTYDQVERFLFPKKGKIFRAKICGTSVWQPMTPWVLKLGGKMH